MCDLVAELRRCEADTANLLTSGAAKRLANWRRYENDLPELNSLRPASHTRPTSTARWELQQKGGRSLEQIVIDCGNPPFTDDDIREARATLGV